jgi:hypothetical protein
MNSYRRRETPKYSVQKTSNLKLRLKDHQLAGGGVEGCFGNILHKLIISRQPLVVLSFYTRYLLWVLSSLVTLNE